MLSAESQKAWADAVKKHGLLDVGLANCLGNSVGVEGRSSRLGGGPPPTPQGKNALTLPLGLMCHQSIKLRQAGFADCIDSEDMFVEWLQEMQRLKLLPPARQEVAAAATAGAGAPSSKL